jgi:Histidine phosphatase superfamily (branch 2)
MQKKLHTDSEAHEPSCPPDTSHANKASLTPAIVVVTHPHANKMHPNWLDGCFIYVARVQLLLRIEPRDHCLVKFQEAKDEQWRRAMQYVSMVSELNYMAQVVIMLYEDPTKDPFSEARCAKTFF